MPTMILGFPAISFPICCFYQLNQKQPYLWKVWCSWITTREPHDSQLDSTSTDFSTTRIQLRRFRDSRKRGLDQQLTIHVVALLVLYGLGMPKNGSNPCKVAP